MGADLFVEQLQIAEGFMPQDLANTYYYGDWVSLKYYDHVGVLFFGAPGAAAEPATISIQQATDTGATAAKALNFTTVYVKQATTNLQGTGQWTKVTQSSSNSYALGSGANGDKAAMVMIEFNSEDLDIENGFNYLRIQVPDVGSTIQRAGALYILGKPRYTPPPSALV